MTTRTLDAELLLQYIALNSFHVFDGMDYALNAPDLVKKIRSGTLSAPAAHLPKITPHIEQELEGTGLIKDGNWTQDAVDFCCVLNAKHAPADGEYQLSITPEWLKNKIEGDPDNAECEAGTPLEDRSPVVHDERYERLLAELVKVSDLHDSACRTIESLRYDIYLLTGVCSYCKKPLVGRVCWGMDCHLHGQSQNQFANHPETKNEK
jgi:hypothetical protein